MLHNDIPGVPDFICNEFEKKKNRYCLLIPILNESGRIELELERARRHAVHQLCDITICDGGSTDGCASEKSLKRFGVNTLLVKTGKGRQGAQLRMGFWWALQRGYDGVITVDGNNKDSVEDVARFIEKLDSGFDFVQGSRFIKGGRAVNTPLSRYLAVRVLHAPVISLTARHCFTDTTNAFRGYSRRYLEDQRVQIFRDVFTTYELLAYLSVRASQLGLKVCEVPVTRSYPVGEKTPTKINGLKGNLALMMILFNNFLGKYNP